MGQIQPGQYAIGQDIIMMAHLIVGTQLPTVSGEKYKTLRLNFISNLHIAELLRENSDHGNPRTNRHANVQQ